MKPILNYNLNVFINCPFDKEYDKIFRAILFTVHRCGFVLRCAKEFDNSNSIRIKNIIKLIDESKYGIHDLSRVDFKDDLPRFNMPLELGIFVGCNEFGSKRHQEKEYLIIESEQFRFKKFISDLSGQDIKAHNNNPQDAIQSIRNWLAKKTPNSIPSPSIIIKEYDEFTNKLSDLCKENNWIDEELQFDEFSSLVFNWLILSGK
jgi:hypothetical protein